MYNQNLLHLWRSFPCLAEIIKPYFFSFSVSTTCHIEITFYNPDI